MQTLTAAPREDLTADQVRFLLTCDDPNITGGLDLLDDQSRFVSDISEYLAGGKISWDNRTAVQGSCQLQIQRQFVWGRDRVRPWLEYTSPQLPDVTARFWLGVYIPTQPLEQRGENPITFDVFCFGLLMLLQTGPGDTWVVESGTSYYDALAAIVTASGIGTPLQLPGSLHDVLLPATRVWAPYGSTVPTWLRMMTDLLKEVGFTAPYMDEGGAITARPYADVAARPSEWTLDTRDPATNLVHDDRSLSIEAKEIPNRWIFVRTDIDTTPVEGDGMYTVNNTSSGDTSQTALGRVIPKRVQLQAADQASLVLQGDKIAADDMTAERTITLKVDPLPIMWFDDCFTYTDIGANGAESEKVLAASWDLNLDGSPGQLVLAGAPRPTLDVVDASERATVTDDAPLSVVVDGATTPSFANALDGASYLLGDRVTVTVRNPLPPLVQGIES